MSNAILIRDGKGILSVDEKDLEEFNLKLSKFYKSNDMKEMKEFLYNKSIKGMIINKELEKKNKNSLAKTRSRSRKQENEK